MKTKKKTGTPSAAVVPKAPGSAVVDAGAENASGNAQWIVLIVLGLVVYSAWSSVTRLNNLFTNSLTGGLYESLGNTVSEWLISLSGQFYAGQLGALLLLVALAFTGIGFTIAMYLNRDKNPDNTIV